MSAILSAPRPASVTLLAAPTPPSTTPPRATTAAVSTLASPSHGKATAADAAPAAKVPTPTRHTPQLPRPLTRGPESFCHSGVAALACAGRTPYPSLVARGDPCRPPPTTPRMDGAITAALVRSSRSASQPRAAGVSSPSASCLHDASSPANPGSSATTGPPASTSARPTRRATPAKARSTATAYVHSATARRGARGHGDTHGRNARPPGQPKPPAPSKPGPRTGALYLPSIFPRHAARGTYSCSASKEQPR